MLTNLPPGYAFLTLFLQLPLPFAQNLGVTYCPPTLPTVVASSNSSSSSKTSFS